MIQDEKEITAKEEITLSAVDFLGLAEQRRVVKVDLSEAGHTGTVYVRELSAGEREMVQGKPGKTKLNRDKSMEIDMSQMPQDFVFRLLKVAMVTDATGTKQMYDEWLKQCGGVPHIVKEKINAIPASVANLLARKVREISGMIDEDRDDVEAEKKGS